MSGGSDEELNEAELDDIINELLSDGSDNDGRNSSSFLQDLKNLGPASLSSIEVDKAEDDNEENSEATSEDGKEPQLLVEPCSASDKSEENSGCESTGSDKETEDQSNDDNRNSPPQQKERSRQGSSGSYLNVFDDEAFLTEETKQLLQELCNLVLLDDLEGVKQFVGSHEDVLTELCLVSNEEGFTPMTLAASLDHLNILKLLQAQAGTWVHCPDRDGFYAIHRAIMGGHKATVTYLADIGQVLTKTRSCITPLYLAADMGHVDIVMLLVDFANVDINEKLSNGRVALHAAAEKGHVAVVSVLLAEDAAVDITDLSGLTSLCLASARGHCEVIKELIAHGADVNFVMPNTMTPLHRAMETRHPEAAVILIENGAKHHGKDRSGMTPVHKAVECGDLTLLQHIVQLDTTAVDIADDEGVTGLLLTVAQCRCDMAQYLLQQGANPNVTDNKGIHALYKAVQKNHPELVKVLLDCKANVDQQAENGTTALYFAAKHGYLDIVALLISSGANIHAARNNGWTPLHAAIHGDKLVVVEQLLVAGADPNTADRQGQTCFAIAAHLRKSQSIKLMAKKYRDPVSVYKVAKLGNSSILRYLDKCGVSMSWTNAFGWTPLHYACKEGHQLAVDVLIKVLSSPFINQEDTDGNTPLYFAVLHGHNRIATSLIHHHAYFNGTNKKGQSCLSVAVQRKDISMTKLFLQNGAIVHNQNAMGETILFRAVETGCVELVKVLLMWGADFNHKAKNDYVPVMLAARLGHTAVLDCLRSKGAMMDTKDSLKNTLLHMAAQEGHLDTVLDLILAKVINVNEENVLGKTALQLAAEDGQTGCVEALLDAGTKIRLLDSEGRVKYGLAKHKEVWEVFKEWARAVPSVLEPDDPDTNQDSTTSHL